MDSVQTKVSGPESKPKAYSGHLHISLVIGQVFFFQKQPKIQSTLVISKSKGPAETLRDIHTSTYQMCRIKENTKQTTRFHK